MALADAALVFVDKLPASEGTVTATSMVGIVVLLLLIYIGYKHGLQGKGAAVLDQLPPGPKGLPVIGNLHQIGKLAHRSLGDMALKYGPIVSLRLGSISTVVVSSPEMAKQILKTHDLTFANRPRICAAKYTAYNYTDIAFAPYGPYWRHMRKTCILKLFNAKGHAQAQLLHEGMQHQQLKLMAKADDVATVKQIHSSINEHEETKPSKNKRRHTIAEATAKIYPSCMAQFLAENTDSTICA